MKRWIAAVALSLGATLGSSVSAKDALHTGLYLVELSDPPALRYGGGTGNLRATAPKSARDRFDSADPAASAYLAHLSNRRSEALEAIQDAIGETPAPRFTYSLTRNGFALNLNPEQARKVALLPQVARVEADGVDLLATLETVPQIRAPQIWNASGPGVVGTRGEGQIIGVIDTGINFDSPAFSASPSDGYTYINPLGAGNYRGWCAPTHPQFNPRYRCNAKLIGAWDFADGIPISAIVNGQLVSGLERDGPVDDNGHGSGTAAVAGGNFEPVVGITGVAPRAHVIAYDACISISLSNSSGACPASTQLAAIEQAILDGVDVINFSIGGGQRPWSSSDRSQAFLDATATGIFVAAAAGNSGGTSTVFHRAPWVASTGSVAKLSVQPFSGSVGTLGPGAPGTLRGIGLDASLIYPDGTEVSDFIFGGDLPCVGGICGGQINLDQCLSTYPVGAIADKLLVCDQRGTLSPLGQLSIVYGLNVARGLPRAIVVIASTDAPLPLLESFGVTPRPNYPMLIAVSRNDGARLRAWVREGGERRGRVSGLSPPAVPRELLSVFSSRGPNPDFDVIKPDVLAPGDRLDTANRGELPGDPAPPDVVVTVAGTSFAGPHVAGAAALLKALRPQWTPAEILSALTTSTEPEIVSASSLGARLGVEETGAGRIDIERASRSGLLLDQSIAGFRAADPSVGGNPGALNLASLNNTTCARSCTWQRRVRNPDSRAHSYTVSTSAPNGVALWVNPSSFTLAAGESQTLNVGAQISSGIAVAAQASGEIFLRSAGLPDIRLPVLLGGANGRRMPVLIALSAQANVQTYALPDFASGSFSGPLAARVSVPSEATEDTSQLIQDPTVNDPYDAGSNTRSILLNLPSAARTVWVDLEASGAADIDLFVGVDLNNDGLASLDEQRCASNGPTGSEQCLLNNLSDTRYWIVAQNFAASQANAADRVTLDYAVVAQGTAQSAALGASVPSTVAAFTPFDALLDADFGAFQARKLVAVLDIGDTLNPTAIGSSVLVFTRTLDGAVFGNGFEPANAKPERGE